MTWPRRAILLLVTATFHRGTLPRGHRLLGLVVKASVSRAEDPGFEYRLVGLVVKASVSRAEDPGFEYRLVGLVVKASVSRAEDPGFFSGSSHTSDVNTGTPG